MATSAERLRQIVETRPVPKPSRRIDPFLPPSPHSADVGIEFADFLDEPLTRTMENNPLTKRTDDSDPIKTNKGRGNYMFDELGRWKLIEFAHMLGMTEREAFRFLETGSHSSKSNFAGRVRATYATIRIVVDHFPGEQFIKDRIEALKAHNSKVGTSIMRLLEQGNTDRALAMAEHSFRDVHEQE